MVLQNKYKARASSKYNAERGGPSSSNGRGRANSSARGRGRDRGAHSSSLFNNDDDQQNSQHQDDDSEQHSGEEEQQQDPNFPSLPTSSKPKDQSRDSNGAREPSSRSKYSRRKLESNSWRYQEEQKDPYEQSDPEPEVDLTNLIARVSSLAANDTLSLSNRPSDQEERQNLEDDIDRSLAYLHSKERDRRNPNSRRDEDRSEKLVSETGGEETEEERERMRLERESMRKDKDKAEALRALKERFQHRNIGDRESPSSNAKAKVLRIGTNPQQAASTSPSASTPNSTSQNHRQSSFTTSFGRNPGSISGGASSVNASRKTSSRSNSLLGGEDDIDTFLDSLSKPVNLSPSKATKNQEKRELNSIKMSPGLSKESISSGGSRSRSRINSIDSQDNNNKSDVGNGNLSPDNFQEMFQAGASSPKNQGSIGKGKSSRKDEMLDRLKFAGSSKDESTEGEKPKAKVENLEDFLDGMLG